MRGAFILIVVMSLLIVGYLVVQEMDNRGAGDDGRIEEIERAREAVGQAEEAMEALRRTLKQEDGL